MSSAAISASRSTAAARLAWRAMSVGSVASMTGLPVAAATCMASGWITGLATATRIGAGAWLMAHSIAELLP